jgi:DNA-binding FrmR family transcriptional regulator
MVDKVLTRLRAAPAALARVESVMLQEHLSHCIESVITGGNPDEQREKATELIQLPDRAR